MAHCRMGIITWLRSKVTGLRWINLAGQRTDGCYRHLPGFPAPCLSLCAGGKAAPCLLPLAHGDGSTPRGAWGPLHKERGVGWGVLTQQQKATGERGYLAASRKRSSTVSGWF